MKRLFDYLKRRWLCVKQGHVKYPLSERELEEQRIADLGGLSAQFFCKRCGEPIPFDANLPK
jgi:hypothetical protein